MLTRDLHLSLGIAGRAPPRGCRETGTGLRSPFPTQFNHLKKKKIDSVHFTDSTQEPKKGHNQGHSGRGSRFKGQRRWEFQIKGNGIPRTPRNKGTGGDQA